IFYIVINVLFLALVFYKMWRQQKALAEEEETEELT
ncbi:TPA: ABC transporter permease, partial [Streptococcus pneumoniae]|nr:ABC transporter permease [Streptococcus pneumoniae]